MTVSELERLSSKVAELQKRKLTLEIELKEVDSEIKKISEGDLADELLLSGLNKVTLDGGTEVVLKTEYYGAIPYESSQKAAAMLTERGVAFNWALSAPCRTKQEVEHATLKLKAMGLEVKSKPDIHHSTYKKICKELDQAGLLDEATQKTLGVAIRRKAQVKTSE